MNVLCVIPSRFSSSRFPGKPLAEINGRPMMWHVYQRCIEADIFDKVCIATDDSRIFEAGENLGLSMVLTSSSHHTGTDRVAEVAEILDAEYYVNVQGDEPLIDPGAIRDVTLALMRCGDQSVFATNGYSMILNPSDYESHNTVKVVFDVNRNAIAYSRYPIPFRRTGIGEHYRQLGLYAFRRKGLEIFRNTKPLALEQAEMVEMYRFLERDLKIRMVATNDRSVPVDDPQDLERVRRLMT